MKSYKLTAQATISIYTEIEANSLNEAIAVMQADGKGKL